MQPVTEDNVTDLAVQRCHRPRPRLSEIMNALVRHCTLARGGRLTESGDGGDACWPTVISSDDTREEFILASDVLGL